MDSPIQRKVGLTGWEVFRICRIAVWLVLLVLVGGLSYLYFVGVPEFLKPPLLEKIRERGFEAHFASARLGWGPVIIIENASFNPTNRASGPRLSAGLTEVRLNWPALLHRRLKADFVEVLNGQVKVPVSDRYGKALSLDKVHLKMRLSQNDFAQLNDFGAVWRGVQIRVEGEITNVSSVNTWKLPSRWHEARLQAQSTNTTTEENIFDKIHFAGSPSLDIHVSGDGRDMNTFRAEASFKATAIETPWAGADGIDFRAAVAHLLDFTNRPFMQVRAHADSVTNHWGTAKNASFITAFYPNPSTPFNALVNFRANDIDEKWNSQGATDWIRARKVSWDGEAALSPENFKPMALDGTVRVVEAESSGGSANALTIDLKGNRAATPTLVDPSWGVWTHLAPYECSVHVVATNIQTPQLQLSGLALNVMWRAPELAIERLDVGLYGGKLDGEGDLDIDSRQLRLRASTDFDPLQISHVLTPAAQRWISQITWQAPPAVKARIRVTLPPWTNRPETWRNDLRDSVQLDGDFSVGAASFRKIEVTSAGANVSYSNHVWNVSGLTAKRGDGSVNIDYTGNQTTREFHVTLDSRVDPDAALPLLEPEQRRLLRDLHFSTPPEVHGEAQGFWQSPGTATFTGTVHAANFTARGETIDEAVATLEYGNRLLRVSDLELSQGAGRLEAPLVTADFASNIISFTNARSTLNPKIIGVAMGTNTPIFLNDIYFDTPPTVRADGSFALGDPKATDVRFVIDGEHFHWTNFGADKISATVQWTGRNVSLTNVSARLYDSGKLDGWMAFTDSPKYGAGFQCDFAATNIDIGQLAKGLNGSSSKLAGKLDGSLALDAPSAIDKETWSGHGRVHIHDALLWDIKIFGVLSPMLNALSPGLGESRAREASAHFVVGDGKVSSDDLDIHSTGVRLLYRGYVTMNKTVNGRAEADLLRDTPVLGPLLSVATTPLGKLFEYQISGSLKQPVFKPLYVPQMFMLLIRPFHTLKTLLEESPQKNRPADGK